MKIETKKDLESVLKLCREHGVTDITIDGITMKLEAPAQSTSGADTSLPLTDREPTPDELIDWSSRSN